MDVLLVHVYMYCLSFITMAIKQFEEIFAFLNVHIHHLQEVNPKSHLMLQYRNSGQTNN